MAKSLSFIKNRKCNGGTPRGFQRSTAYIPGSLGVVICVQFLGHPEADRWVLSQGMRYVSKQFSIDIDSSLNRNIEIEFFFNTILGTLLHRLAQIYIF